MSLAVSLDGVDVSGVVIRGSSTRRLNRPSQAQITIPMDAAVGGAGSKLKISFDGQLHHHGTVLDCETDSGEDDGYTVYNSSDPMELWQWRPARDDTCDFSKPSFIEDYVTGPQIIEDILNNSENCGGSIGPPTFGEGPLFLDFGTFEAGGVDLTGAPTDWPMTIAQVASLLISTGELDIVITPTDPGGGIMGTVDCYNGDFGTDLTGSVVFQYGMGARNVRRVRWNEDMTNLTNKIWYYLGPRVLTPEDPAGDQHWRANITGDDPNLAFPPGGKLSPPASATNNQLGVLREDSQTSLGPAGTGFGVRMDIRIYDARGDEAAVGRDLYRRLWQAESWLRATPRELIHITPIRGFGINAFDIGDLVTVEAGSQVRGGFSGAQRIYEYTISWDEDGPFELSELQTSPNNEGF